MEAFSVLTMNCGGIHGKPQEVLAMIAWLDTCLQELWEAFTPADSEKEHERVRERVPAHDKGSEKTREAERRRVPPVHPPRNQCFSCVFACFVVSDVSKRLLADSPLSLSF